MVGEKYDCTMIFSLVWMENSTPDGQTANHRAHYLFWGYDYYMTTMIFFFSLDTPSRLPCLVIKSDQTSTYHQLPSYLVLTTRFVAGVSSCGCVVRSCKYVVVVELLGSMVVD